MRTTKRPGPLIIMKKEAVLGEEVEIGRLDGVRAERVGAGAQVGFQLLEALPRGAGDEANHGVANHVDAGNALNRANKEIELNVHKSVHRLLTTNAYSPLHILHLAGHVAPSHPVLIQLSLLLVLDNCIRYTIFCRIRTLRSTVKPARVSSVYPKSM